MKITKVLKYLIYFILFATLFSYVVEVFPRPVGAAPLPAPPGPCDIPKSQHHTPTGWVNHIRSLVENGSYKSPWVGQLRVAVGQEFVPHVRSAGLITTVTIAAYITACDEWLFIKYRQIGGRLRFVTHYFPRTGLTYIVRSVARDAVRYVWATGSRAVSALRAYWTSAFFMTVPSCVDWTSPWYDAYDNCGGLYDNPYVVDN
ncbi:hypothetical protein D6833_02920 [Candidatus Parcubacteria bacterium]|nr:MAG: hypothetical protein D6833_02920 [Candidatus Parcubacteria bacterium]